MRAWVGTGGKGCLVDPQGPAISLLDHGFTVADGVFETLKVIDGVPFALTRHLRRLGRSAQAMHLPPPEESWVREAVGEVLADADPMAHGRLRITYTSGIAPLGSDRGDASPTLTVAVMASVPWPATTTAVTVPWTRNERSAITGVKSTSYAENVVALHRAHAQGASEALFADTRGRLSEGAGTNVFVVLSGELLTPSLACGCLAGITRELLLEWTTARECELPIEALGDAEEVFLTSSTRDVHPVTRIDARTFPGPGPITGDVRATFTSRAGADPDP